MSLKTEPIFIVIALLSAGLVAAQPQAVTAQRANKLEDDARGRLVRTEVIGGAIRDQVAQGLAATGWSDVVVKSGIILERIVYTTIDADGSPAMASGLVALPTDMEPIGTVVFEHGTTSEKTNVPSTPGSGEGQAMSALFASGGFVLLAPDYIGLGLSPGAHPYLHAASEATATVDLLSAARRAVRELNMKLPQEVYLTGFSQGGQAALATDRVIEKDRDSPWKVAAVAPVAGPYDLSGTEFPDLLNGPSPESVAYLAYLAHSYMQVYGAESGSDIFTPPYDTQVTSLFDGNHPLEEIAQSLPSPIELFRPEFLAGVSEGSNSFALELRANDTARITPHAPVRLYYGDADVDVFPRNTEVAMEAMKSAGVHVMAIDLGPNVDHPGSADLGLRAARAWFDTLAAQRLALLDKAIPRR